MPRAPRKMEILRILKRQFYVSLFDVDQILMSALDHYGQLLSYNQKAYKKKKNMSYRPTLQKKNITKNVGQKQ